MSDKSITDRLLETITSVKAMDEAATDLQREVDEGELEPVIHSELPAVELKEIETALETEAGTDIQEDYKRARGFTYMLQEVSTVMLKNVVALAVGTQHPKAYDTFNNIMTTMRGLNKDLLEINKAAVEAKTKVRTLPVKEVEPQVGSDNGGMEVTTDENGNEVRVRMSGPRPTSKSILDVIKAHKESGKEISNEEIMALAQEIDIANSKTADEGEIIQEAQDGGDQTSEQS